MHKLTRDQFDGIQDLKKKAKVLILNAEQPATELKSLPPPADRPIEVEDAIDRSEPGEATNEDEV